MNIQDFAFLHPELHNQGQTLILNLDHGKANEMGSQALKAWEALTEYLQSGKVQSLITTSNRQSKSGKAIFISGADVTERVGWDDDKIKAHVRWQRNVLSNLRKAPVFHIAIANGLALGWGTEFMLCCDYRLATGHSTFALPETRLGILPGAGGTSELWMEIGVAHALRLGMTGEFIDGSESTRIGLTQEFHQHAEDAFKRALMLCDMVNRKSPSAIAAFKTALLQSRGLNSTDRQELEAQAYEHCVASGDAAIGRHNFAKINQGEAIEWADFRPFS